MLYLCDNNIKYESSSTLYTPLRRCRNYDLSRSFYRDLGFEEKVLSPDMSLFKTQQIGFYLQDAYVKDWIDNTMIFVEVEDVDRFWNELVN
jgi:hypothetical protein